MRLTFTRISASILLLAGISQHARGQSPGGVSTNLKLWLKANDGVTATGGSVTAWADKSGLATPNSITGAVGTRPNLVANALNGYPVVSYAGTGGLTGAFNTAITSSRSAAYIVTLPGSAVNSGLFTTGVANGDAGSNLYSIQFLARNTGVSVASWRSTFRGNYTAANAVSAYHLYTSIYNTTQNLFYNEGKAATAASFTQSAYNLTRYALGGWYSGTTLQSFPNGQIAEVIFYDEASTAIQQQQIQSYLALKYGFSLDQTVATNYLNSAGSVIFNAGTGGTQVGYANNVVGVLVDNGSGLSQSSSRSVNTGALLGISDPSTTLSDGEYIIAGDNGAAVTGRSTDVPAGYGQRLTRVWRVSKSAAAATVTIKIYIGDIPELVLPARSLSNVAILKSSAPTFGSATAYAASGTAGIYNDTLVIPNVALGNSDYFTLGIGTNTPPVAGAGDFDFWFGVPEWSAQFPTPQRLHLVGASPNEYSYYIIDEPANPAFTPITGTIAPGTSKVLDMSNYVSYGSIAAPSGVSIVARPANTVVNAGLRITIKGKAGGYYSNDNSVNIGSFPLRGPNALGTSFYIPGQNRFTNSPFLPPSTSEFIITATQNNTQVVITPSEAIVGHGANVPFSIVLNQGQSYQAQNLSRNGIHLAGSKVTANKPVVVTYSDDVINSGSGEDNTGDQLVPVIRYGNDYVHIRTSLTFDYLELLYLTGSQPNTTITIFDGTTTRTRVLGAGQTDSVSLMSGKNVQYIHSDKPILAYQFGGGAGELGSAVLTPAIGCKGTDLIAYQYHDSALFANFNFMVPAGNEGSFLINGSPSIITAADFSPVPGYPGYKWCRKNVTSIFTPGQTIVIKNTAGKFFFYVNIKSYSSGDFCNFSDFGNVVLFPKVSNVCGNSTVNLTSGAIAYNAAITAYSWQGPNGFISAQPNPTLTSLTSADSGWYRLTVSDNNGCDYTDSVLVDRPITTVMVTPTPSSACVGSTINFSSEQIGGGYDSLKWSGPAGFTSTQKSFVLSNVTTSQAGTYTATYYDRYGCAVTGNTAITISNATISPLTVSGIEKINCNTPTTTLGASTYAQGIGYQLYSPFNASSIFLTNNFKNITPGFYNQSPSVRGTASQMNLNGLTGINTGSASYAVQYDGYIYLASAGTYTFYTSSKDGSNLFIDGSQVVSNDGGHALTEIASSPLILSAGYHKINANYFVNAAGSAALTVSYSATSPALSKTAIPASILYYASGSTPTGSNYTNYTYTWGSSTNNSFTATGTTIAVSSPGTYNLTATEPGGCTSITPYNVTSIGSYDYGDLPIGTWPAAQAAVVNCLTNDAPSGANAAVWAGAGVSYENAPLTSAAANADGFDDGLGIPSGAITGTTTPYSFTVTMNSNITGKTVYYGLWFDWNNNGNFADDVDANNNPSFYSGSGVTASPVTVTVPVIPAHGASPNYKTRLMVSDAPVGFADFGNTIGNGEIEDYQAPIIALPVTFGDVKIIGKNCKAYVDFETFTETSSSHFIIERSKDAKEWHTAATIKAQGNSANHHVYSYVDNAPYKGLSYYRIRQIDLNGTYTITKTTAINNECTGTGAVSVYPNPASECFQVQLSSDYEQAEIYLFNQLGQQLPTSVTGGGLKRTVSTSGMVSGTYLLKVINADHAVYTQLITITN